MSRDYIPLNDQDFEAWADNFSTLITANPTSYTLTAAIATTLAGKFSDFQTKLEAATNPATRGGSTILAKRDSRTDLENYCRELAGVIRGAMTVTNEQRYNLGLTVKDTQPTPVQPPQDPPVLEVAAMNGWRAKLHLKPLNSDGRGKPPGVAGANIYTFVGATPPTDINVWKFEGDSSRAIFELELPAELAAGTKVFICAAWKNPRFQTGPACTPIPVIVGGGVTGMAA